MNLQLPIIFLKNRLFQTCIIVKRTCISIFSKIGLVDQSKPCTQVYLQKFANCINLQLAMRISKNHTFRTCTTTLRTFMLILRSIGLLGISKYREKKLFPQTDGQTSRTTIIGSFFFEKRKKLLKTHLLEHVFSNFSGSKITHSKSVARYVVIIIMLYNK